MMTKAEWDRRFDELLKKPLESHEIIENDRPCPVYVCKYTRRKMVKVTIDCVIDLTKEPRRYMHHYGRSGITVYLNDQNHKGPVKKIVITRVNERSAWADVVEVT